MFRSAARPAVQAVARASVVRDFSATATQNATLREIEGRLKSVKNIEKITKSMKMIASTKLARAQRSMAVAKQYGAANNELFKYAEATAPENAKVVYVTVSSDSGLCGGIHSSVTKATKKALSEHGDAPLIVLGDRSRNQLQRSNSGNLALTFNQLGKQVPTFGDAAAIADTIISSGIEFDQVNIIYNKFISALSYEPDVLQVYNEQAILNAPNFKVYELEEDVVKDLSEFALANAIYAALVEGHAAEISARRNAMDNASKNAGDMIGSLQMKFNRGRQAVITTELIDIITGASAL